jgi:hypothetical protein
MASVSEPRGGTLAIAAELRAVPKKVLEVGNLLQ